MVAQFGSESRANDSGALLTTLRVTAIHPTQVFGRDSTRYQHFLQTLLDGLLEHETKVGGVGHAPEPLPAA